MRKPHVPCEWSRLAGRPSHGAGPSPPTSASKCNEHAAFSSSSGCGPYLVRMIHGKKARPIQKDGTLQRVLVGGPGPAPTVGHPWVGPPGASTCNEHAAFSSGCGPYLVRMIHGKKARPIQKDGTFNTARAGGWTWACTSRGSKGRMYRQGSTLPRYLGKVKVGLGALTS